MSVSFTQQLNRVGMSMAIMLATVASATAQSTTESRPASRNAGAQRQTGQSQTSNQDHDNKLDKQIAACLHLGNQEEIILSQFGQQKAQNPEVKQFAQMMIEHHQQAISKIEQAAPQLAKANLKLASNVSTTSGNRSSTTASSQSSPQSGSDQQVAAATSTADRNSGNTQASYETSVAGGQEKQLQLAKSIKQQCIQLNQQELSEKQGAEFDKAFMGMQVAAHVSMLAELRASKEFAGSELQQVISEGEQMTQEHLTQAKSIMKQIKDQQGGQRTAAQ